MHTLQNIFNFAGFFSVYLALHSAVYLVFQYLNKIFYGNVQKTLTWNFHGVLMIIKAYL